MIKRSLSMRALQLLCLYAAGALASPSFAQTAARAVDQAATVPTRTLVIGIKIAPPFVVADKANGEDYSGLGIDLWTEAAQENGWEYQYREYDLDDLLEAVATGEVDVGIGAITATAGREQTMDFAHPVYSSGLGIAVRSEASAGWFAVARALVSPAFLKIICVLVLLLGIIGLLVWLFEHRKNPDEFGGTRAEGLFSGFWWAMVTMTTVGYGDISPRTVGGRLLGMVWMLAALIIVSFFSASITSALTVGQLSNRVRNADDLASMKVATLPHSTSDAWLRGRNVTFNHAKDLDQALEQLASGEVDAVVYDTPLLRWTINQRHRGQLQVLPITLERQDYAFALPTASPLREPLDTSVLRHINSPDWPERLKQYFGKD